MNTALPFPGLSSPAVGTESPIQLMGACHSRVDKQLRTLERLCAYLPNHGSDQQAQEAATGVLRYFDLAAPHHHADEEQDLFPALLDAMAGSDATCIRELQSRVLSEHRQLEGLWRALREQLLRIVEGQPQQLTQPDLDQFVQAYEAHMALEDHEILPMAERLLDASTLAQMGARMRERRQAT